MVELVDRLVGGLEAPLRAFCWKARGGGGSPTQPELSVNILLKSQGLQSVASLYFLPISIM